MCFNDDPKRDTFCNRYQFIFTLNSFYLSICAMLLDLEEGEYIVRINVYSSILINISRYMPKQGSHVVGYIMTRLNYDKFDSPTEGALPIWYGSVAWQLVWGKEAS